MQLITKMNLGVKYIVDTQEFQVSSDMPSCFTKVLLGLDLLINIYLFPWLAQFKSLVSGSQTHFTISDLGRILVKLDIYSLEAEHKGNVNNLISTSTHG